VASRFGAWFLLGLAPLLWRLGLMVLLGNQFLDIKIKLPFKVCKYLVIIIENFLSFSCQAQILKREVSLFMNVSIVIL
jgi:hypothetical protein